MKLEELITQLTAFKETVMINKGRLMMIPKTAQFQAFIDELPAHLKLSGYDDAVVNDIHDIAKVVPGNHPSKLEQLIDKLKTIS